MARGSLVGDEFSAPLFKRREDGWIFHTQGWTCPEGRGLLTPPWRTANFLVDDAQRAALVPILQRLGRFYAKAVMASMLLAGAVFFAVIAVFHLSHLSVAEFALVFGLSFGGLTLAFLALFAGWRLPAFQDELRTVLARAPRTEERISLGDRVHAKATVLSSGKLAGGFAVFGLALAANLHEIAGALPMKATATAADWGLLALNVFGSVVFVGFLIALASMVVMRRANRRGTAT